MKKGDKVVYLVKPWLYGEGEIVQVLGDGRLEVTFDKGGQTFTDSFDPFELELAEVWAEQQAAELDTEPEGALPQPDPGYGRPGCS